MFMVCLKRLLLAVLQTNVPEDYRVHTPMAIRTGLAWRRHGNLCTPSQSPQRRARRGVGGFRKRASGPVKKGGTLGVRRHFLTASTDTAESGADPERLARMKMRYASWIEQCSQM